MSVSNEILERIENLKKKQNAVIIAHNYQIPEVQNVADLLGDSFALATEAVELKADAIVFCGVNFMAETAKIISPDKVIVHPEPEARCPMADMCEVPFLRKMRSEHPDAVVVSYVNTTAEVKAESDVCCTSGNAVRVIKSLGEREIIFTPDRNLGLYVQRFVPDKKIILWPGFCAVHHNKVTAAKLESLKGQHPDAEILVHPECVPEVIDYADFVFSTHGMLVHAKKSPASEFILGTEKEMAYRLSMDVPGKRFYAIGDAICQNMKSITLEKVIRSLETLEPVVELPPDIMARAKLPLDRMVDIGRGEFV